MAFFRQSELLKLGFKKLGSNVKISDKSSIYNPEQISLGDNSRIDDFCVVSGNVTLGRNVHIAVFCNVAGGEKGIVFEDFSGLAYGCHVFSQSDDYSGETMTNPTVPDEYKSEKKERIVIGRHVILGTQSIVFPGVTLAEGSASGAGTVITQDTEAWSLYVGNPAKKIKDRSRRLLALERQYLQGE